MEKFISELEYFDGDMNMEKFISKLEFSEKDREFLHNSEVENAKVSEYDFTYTERQFIFFHYQENGKVFYKVLDVKRNWCTPFHKSESTMAKQELLRRAKSAAKYVDFKYRVKHSPAVC